MNEQFLLIMFAVTLLGADAKKTLATANKLENYGPFQVSVFNVSSCRGPKRNDSASMAAVPAKNGTLTQFNINVFKKVKIAKFRISIWMDRNEEEPILEMKSDNPCRHFLMGPLLKQFYKTDHRCEIQKGEYTFLVDQKKIFEEFTGKAFYYGDISARCLLLSRDTNVFCSFFNVITTPK